MTPRSFPVAWLPNKQVRIRHLKKFTNNLEIRVNLQSSDIQLREQVKRGIKEIFLGR